MAIPQWRVLGDWFGVCSCNTSGLEPAADIWTASAQPWDNLNPHIPKYERQPTPEEVQALMALRG